MGIVVTQSQDAAAQGRLASLASQATLIAGASAHAVGAMSLAAALAAAVSQPAHAVASLGSLISVLQVQALNVNTARVVATLPRLAAAATATASQPSDASAILRALGGTAATATTQPAAARAALGPLVSVIGVQATNVNTAHIVASLPGLRGAGATTTVGVANAVSRLPLASHGAESASQAVHAKAVLPNFWVSTSLTAEATGTLRATLGALASAVSVQPPPSGYPVDDNFYAALPARAFVASLPARDFYAALPARDFYVLDKP